MKAFQRRYLASAALLCGMVAQTQTVAASQEQAAALPIELHISSQPLVDALTEFARQAGLQLLLDADEAAQGMSAPALSGSYTPEGALKVLLANASLRYEFLDPRTVAIRAVQDGARKPAAEISSSSASAMRLARSDPSGSLQKVQDANSSDSAKAEDENKLNEIIVTAQRRASSIQDLAISARALTSEELQRLGANSVEEYAGFVPGLNLIQAGGPGRTQIEMRGVSIGAMRDDRPEFGPTVGVYLDESPIAAQTVNANIALMDLERIEVMRGPQATLYGAGSLSGTVRMIARKPDLTKVGGRLTAGTSYTNSGEESYDLSGIANFPLIDNALALRTGGFYRKEGGYLDNVVLGEKDINDSRDVGGKLALRYVPREDFRMDASFGYQESDIGANFYYFEEAGDLKTQIAIPTPRESKLTVASLVAEKDFSLGTLTSATSYFGNDSLVDEELSRVLRFITGQPFDGPPEPGDTLAASSTFFELKEYTQEFRFVSKDDHRVSWIVGALFQRKDHSFGQDVPVPGIDNFIGIDSTDFSVEPNNLFKSRVDSRTTQYSLFGEASAKLTDRLTLKAGLRWFDVSQDSATFFGGIFAVPNIGTAPASSDDNGINPTFNLSYQIDRDRMVYLQAARGFRLGGTNEPVPETLCAADLAAAGFAEPPESFDSDSLWNYEAGLKSSWLNDRLRVNAAGYVIDWKDPAYPVAFACGFSSIINAGSQDITGVELDVESVLAKGLVSRVGFSYTDSKLGEDVPLIGGVKGDRAPLTPEFTASASLDYDFPVARLGNSLMAFVHGDVRWVGDGVTTFPLSGGGSQFFDVPAYSEGNFRAGVYSEAWRLEAFVTNLWNERPQFAKSVPVFAEFTGTTVMTSRPRTFGLQISREF